MTLPVPLSVRLRTDRTDRHVTNQLKDLSFRSACPGGYASAAFSFDRPISVQPAEIAEYAHVYIYDRNSGATLWEGRLEDPGRGVGSDGQIWEISAVGPSAHAQDRTIPLIYIDRSTDGWVKCWASATTAGSTGIEAEIGSSVGDPDVSSLMFRIPQGLTLATNAEHRFRYNRIRQCGQKLGAYDFNWDAGLTASDLLVETVSRQALQTDYSASWSTAGGTPSGNMVVVANFPNGQDALDVRIRYTGAGGTVADSVHWLECTGFFFKALLYNANGTEKTTGYTATSWTADIIVRDVLGRLLPKFDGAGASIATCTHDIDHLVYPDGVTAEEILADMMVLEPTFFWAAWESDPSSGLNRFEWTAWPLTVRYEATATDGFDSPGSSGGLFNAVSVRWTDSRRWIRRTRRTQTVTILDDAGLVREAFIDLGDNMASTANATRAGDQFLAEHAVAPNAGTLTIARPIVDLVTGRRVQPWEILPGSLIRVRGVLPRPNTLNPVGRDGVTVFRVVGVDYSASSTAATLELDSPPVTLPRQLAKIRKSNDRAQRRR